MKKIINVIILISILILFICNNVYATSITLEQIVEKFNASSIVDDYKNAGGSINATNDVDSINVEININGKIENIEFLLHGNILSIEIDKEKEESEFVKEYIASIVIDIIGQLHGYQKWELLPTITSDKATNYTLEKEGFEVENISANKSKIKVDITKKIPLADFSDTYIEVSDLKDLEKYISGDGSAQIKKGNIWFNKMDSDGKYTLLVAEKDNLTENTYKSVLSILEVMFNSDNVIEYFKNNYPNISAEDKNFSGFSIKVNPTDKTQFEETIIDSGYKFVRITIDKSLVISSATKTEKLENKTPNNNNSQTQLENKLNLDKLPRTGEEINEFLIVLYIIVGISSVGLVALLSLKKENNY